MEASSSTEEGDLVIDVTLSDEEESNDNDKEVPHTAFPEVNLSQPASESVDGANLRIGSSENPDLKTISKPLSANSPAPLPSIIPHTNSNLMDIMSNYSASELARVNTQVLIECIGRFPALWDSKDDLYKNYSYSSILWSNIAGVLNMSVKQAKCKWSKVRSIYRKEYFKSKETGVNSRHPFFDALSFLEEETKLEKERADFEKLKVISALVNGLVFEPSTAAKICDCGGCNSVFYDGRREMIEVRDAGKAQNATTDPDTNEEECWLIEDEEESTPGTVSALDRAPQVPELGAQIASEPTTKLPNDSLTLRNLLDASDRERNTVGSIFKSEPAKLPIIRPKNISDLLAVPHVTPSTSSFSLAQDRPERSPSPEIIFVSENLPSVGNNTNIIVSNAFPSPGVENARKTKASPKSKTKKKKKSKRSFDATQSTDEGVLTAQAQCAVCPEKTSVLREQYPTPCSKKFKSNHQDGSHKKDKRREEDDVNRGFLSSLLPDVENMTNAQFRRFKKRATELVSMILD